MQIRQNLLLTIILLVFLLVGCGEEPAKIQSGDRISTAPRGVSLMATMSTTVLAPTSAATATTDSKFIEMLTPTVEVEVTPSPVISDTVEPTSTFDEIIEDTACVVDLNGGLEAEVISLMNVEREKNGVKILAEQSQLTEAAREHSTDMACNNFFDHVSVQSGTVIERAEKLEYEYTLIGENIAAGYLSAEEVVAAWMDSPGHRENILNPEYTQVGLGYVFYSGSNYGSYWTAVYGTP